MRAWVITQKGNHNREARTPVIRRRSDRASRGPDHAIRNRTPACLSIPFFNGPARVARGPIVISGVLVHHAAILLRSNLSFNQGLMRYKSKLGGCIGIPPTPKYPWLTAYLSLRSAVFVSLATLNPKRDS